MPRVRQNESTPEDIEERGLIASLDRLQQMADKQRQTIYGEKFFEDTEKFFNLSYLRAVQSPSFRPNVMVPELQHLMMNEASDLLDNNPRIYITEKAAGTPKQKQRATMVERALQAQWESGHFNLQLLYAQLWAMFAGNGYIQVWYNADAKGGLGEVQLFARHPASVYVDPSATSDDDAYFVQVEDLMYLDEIRSRWPETGDRVKPMENAATTRSTGFGSLQFVPGPMRSTGDLIMRQPGGFESQVLVRTTYIRDSTREPFEGGKDDYPAGMPRPRWKLKYPKGRVIVDAGGVILQDSENLSPTGEFPLVRLPAMPTLTGYYAPPPVNYSKDLQNLAEKFFSRTYENALRVNNVITFIYRGSGVDYGRYGGLPGEVHQLNLQGKKPEVLAPPAFPDSIIKMPGTLLELQRMIQGFSNSRQGNPGAGNISAPLFEGAISQAQGMTRLRGKLLGPAVTRVARLVLSYMQYFYTAEHEFDVMSGEDVETISWEGKKAAKYRVTVDPGSIRPMSQSAIRQIAPKLFELHAIDQKALLDSLDWPDREGIMERMAKAAQEQALLQAKEKLRKDTRVGDAYTILAKEGGK